MNDQIRFMYEAGETRRFHTVPVLRSQNIADHSWHVAMIAYHLYGQEEPGITVQFLMACLSHDMAECKVGDLPAPAKRGMEELMDFSGSTRTFREAWGQMEEGLLSQFGLDWDKFLSDEERRRLKFCDSVEGALYCIQERRMGNQTIAACYLNFINYITGLLTELSEAETRVRAADEEPTVSQREWELRAFLQMEWSKANGC